MSRSFKLIDTAVPAPSTSSHQPTVTDWKLCLLCQEDKEEPLTFPSKSKRKDVGSGYSSLADNLIKFDELGYLPLSLERLDEGNGIEMAMIANNARYHQSCKLKYNNTKLQRVEKRARAEDSEEYNTQTRSTPKRSRNSVLKDVCFFCETPPGISGLHEAATFQVNRRVHTCAVLLEDTEILAKLSAADMVALEAKYHTKCLVNFYNRARRARAKGYKGTDNKETISGIVFTELVLYIEETRQQDEESSLVFKLSDLSQLYISRMKQLGVKVDMRVHTTRLKERLLCEFTDMRPHKKGRDVLLAFEEDIGTALARACDFDSDSDAIHLARAAKIVRDHMFGRAMPFNGFAAGCQKEAVSPLLLALVNMILEGPSITDHCKDTTPAALSIAQLLKFNSVKHKRKKATTDSVRHNTAQETPVPTYIGLMLHAHTRKKELVDRLHHLGISISYDRVLRLSAQMGNRVCKQFHSDHVVCPPSLRGNIFTTAAIDNIDHNPSSTISKESFHGTGISLFQHPTSDCDGVVRNATIVEEVEDTASKSISDLPHFYTDVPPVTNSIKKPSVSATIVASLNRSSYDQHAKEEYCWLDQTKKILSNDDETHSANVSWAAYHASHQSTTQHVICHNSLLPLFHESAHTLAMIKHSFNVIKRVVEHLNPGQAPVLTFDQPLYALAKQIQWNWPEEYGEDKYVIMFGGLHIEMAALKTLGDWLRGSGWVQALIQAEITTPGTADSFLQAAHVVRTRRVHQITIAALYILQHRAYDHYRTTYSGDEKDLLGFQQWSSHREQICPQFQYWKAVMEMEICVLVFIRSLRLASFTMYLDALTELTPWFFALDHTNYARWIPVHLRDMAELSSKHPAIVKEFNDGKFVVHKTPRVFSDIAIDQAHEQNNALIKGDGGAVGLTDNRSALQRWMVAGPEVARVVKEFHNELHQCGGGRVSTDHHDQTPSVQAAFAKDVHSLVNVMEDLSNPFEEESTDLLVLDSKVIVDHAAVETVQNARRIGQEQFQAFVQERLIERAKPIDGVIHRNKLKLFRSTTRAAAGKGKQQVASLKMDVDLFSRLYIGCQTRDGNLGEFFRHENQACPPALSDGGNLYLGTKSDLLTCLTQFSGVDSVTTVCPVTSIVILDGAAIIQMLKPVAVKTFEEYTSQIFVPYIMSQFQKALRVDLVWDRYIEGSLKSTARAKRGKGIPYSAKFWRGKSLANLANCTSFANILPSQIPDSLK